MTETDTAKTDVFDRGIAGLHAERHAKAQKHIDRITAIDSSSPGAKDELRTTANAIAAALNRANTRNEILNTKDVDQVHATLEAKAKELGIATDLEVVAALDLLQAAGTRTGGTLDF